MKLRLGIVFLLIACNTPAVHANEEEYQKRREALADEIKKEVAVTRGYTARAALDSRVLEALRTVPRHKFVPRDQRRHAYENRPLPIGHGQTISQPYIVAIMTELLDVGNDSVVLEIGTGSGYQAAILSPLVKEVYTIEIVEPLGKQAGRRLANLGYKNVTARVGDGYHGWPEKAPFDAIIVTAAADHIPPPLVKQLKPGGRMMIPVGGPFMTQQLVLVKKDAEDGVQTRQLLPVRFVPLTRKR